MRKTLPFLFALFLITTSSWCLAQEKSNETYRISRGNDNSEIEKYKTAFENGNWKCYRTLDNSRFIKFENGIEFELFSANKLKQLGYNAPTDCLSKIEDIEAAIAPTYSITANGHIMEAHQSYKSAKEIKSRQQK